MKTFIFSLLAVTSLSALRYEQPCTLIFDTIWQERYLIVEGHTYYIICMDHMEECEMCAAEQKK